MSKWESEIPTIKELLKANKSIAEIGEYYGFTRDYMRTIFKRLRRRGLLPSREDILNIHPPLPPDKNQKITVLEYPDKKNPTFNYRQFLKTAVELQRIQKDKATSQLEATVKIYTDKHFAVSFTSDWHIGNIYTDYEALLGHVDLWLSTPNLFLGTLGDLTDNFVKPIHKSGLFSAIFGPQDQHDIVLEMFKDLGKKTIFAQGGNHEGFTFDETGFDLASSFYKGIEAPFLREGGGINLLVNDLITYRIYAKHRYRFNSQLNITSAVKRMHDIESPFDIGVLGHYHVPTLEHTHKWSGAMQKDVVYIVTGSYKIDDKWTREMGFAARGTIGCPTVIFSPREKKMLPFRYVEDAVLILNNLNK